MKRLFYRTLVHLLLVFLSVNSVFALELDMSVDEEIRKHYNPSKLELEQLPSIPEVEGVTPELPPLPSVPAVVSSPQNSSSVMPPKTTPIVENPSTRGKVKKGLPNTSRKNDIAAVKIKGGTTFKVKSQTKIADWNTAGAGVTFVTTAPVYSRYVTIPAGTVFHGSIVNSHQPQASGNGGLLVLKAESMRYNGRSYNVDAKITKANSKKIFFNNIKGERKYWKNVAAQVNKGENFYKKTRRTSSKLANNPVGLFISPIPTIAGIAVYAVNLAGSPLIAIASKGSHINLPAGTSFEIKLLEDVYLY